MKRRPSASTADEGTTPASWSCPIIRSAREHRMDITPSRVVTPAPMLQTHQKERLAMTQTRDTCSTVSRATDARGAARSRAMTSAPRVPAAPRALKLLICIVGMFTACDDTPNDGADLGEPPDEAAYCLIEVGKTTTADARDILGMETSATQSQSVTMLIYRYGEGADGKFAVLQFEHDVFLNAVMMGVPFPACWKTGLEPRSREVDAPSGTE
jgi:hypothetical protein